MEYREERRPHDPDDPRGGGGTGGGPGPKMQGQWTAWMDEKKAGRGLETKEPTSMAVAGIFHK